MDAKTVEIDGVLWPADDASVAAAQEFLQSLGLPCDGLGERETVIMAVLNMRSVGSTDLRYVKGMLDGGFKPLQLVPVDDRFNVNDAVYQELQAIGTRWLALQAEMAELEALSNAIREQSALIGVRRFAFA